MIYQLEELAINHYYIKFIDGFSLMGLIDVTDITIAFDNNQRNNHYDGYIYNIFDHTSCECTLRATGEQKYVMPTFFGKSNGFIFDSEYYNHNIHKMEDKQERTKTIEKINITRPYVIFYHGNDDLSMGQRFKTPKERQSFFLLGAEAGTKDLERWN